MRLLQSMEFMFAAGACLLAANAAQAGCNLEMVASLPAKIDNGRVFVPGTMDAHPVDYLVDLASLTALLTVPAERMSIKPTGSGVLDKIVTLGEPGPDQFTIKNLPLRLAGNAENFGAPGEVAVLGMDFFGRYDVEFDAQHGKINLFTPTGCETVKLAYWPGPSSVAEMVPNPAHSNIPPLDSYNFPHINIRLKVDGQDMLAALDTGYGRSSLNLSAAHAVGLVAGNAGTAEAEPTLDLFTGAPTPTWSGSVKSVALGQETVAPAKMEFRTFSFPTQHPHYHTGDHMRSVRYDVSDMMLGADFLIAHRVFISQSQKKVYFSPAENATFLAANP